MGDGLGERLASETMYLAGWYQTGLELCLIDWIKWMPISFTFMAWERATDSGRGRYVFCMRLFLVLSDARMKADAEGRRVEETQREKTQDGIR